MFDRASIAVSIAVVLGITSGAFASSQHHRNAERSADHAVAASGYVATPAWRSSSGFVQDTQYGYTGAGPYGHAGVGPYGYSGAGPYGYAGVGPYDYAARYGYGGGAMLIQDRDYSASNSEPYCAGTC
jgi:hypothetical protein